ncbi:hypothetical protein OQA88_7883 [Cercophora sp. LCS_1]
MPLITINGNTLDPEAPTLKAFGLAQEMAKDSNYILIQTDGPLTKEVKRTLADKKVDVQQKVSDDTYLCRYEPEDLSEIRDLPFITYANIYQEHFVVASSLKVTPAAASPTHPLLPEPAHTNHIVNVDVEFHDDVSVTPELVRALATAAHLDAESLETQGHKTRLTIQCRYLSDVAAIDQVRSIHEVHPNKLHNDVAREVLRLKDVIHPTQAARFEGEGQLVCVADTGFDEGTTNPAKVRAAFKDQAGNVRVRHLYGSSARGGATTDPDGHGTHVCGSVLGDEVSGVTGERIQGTAPKATLVMQSLLDRSGGLGGIPDDLGDLFLPPYQDHGARIHTNSWGSSPRTPSQLPYDPSSAEIDDFVHSHRDMVILFAAGNDGIDAKRPDGVIDPAQIGSQAAAKNCISVGASESFRPDISVRYSQFGFPRNPLGSDLVANDPRGMAAFSSRGPTKEGRVKPDVVAPGTCILSVRASVRGQQVGDSGSWGVSEDPKFMYEGGTSMATPLVAGCCAVIREALVKSGVTSPSAALIKALLINGAVELVGQYTPTEAGRSPNDASGWGRVDVANTVVIGSVAGETGMRVNEEGTAGFADEGAAVDTFEEIEFPVVVENQGTLKVTLVWTDPAGAELQNDLDLIVVVGEQEMHGNQADRKFKVKSKAQRDKEERATPASGHGAEPFDRKNNVEQVVWDGVEGQAKIVVRGHNVKSLGGQTFALVWKTS